jgi:hypothetical protein
MQRSAWESVRQRQSEELQKTTTVEAVYPMAYETFEGVVETFRASRQFDDYHLRGSWARKRACMTRF